MMLELVDWTTKTPFVSTHGKMEQLVQQRSKTLSLVMFAIIIVTQGERRGKGLDTKTLLSSK